MSTETETKVTQEQTPTEDHGHALTSFGLPHLIACLGTAIAVVIAINVFD
jgi:hypothetical protein